MMDPLDDGVRNGQVAYLNSIRHHLPAGQDGFDDYTWLLKQHTINKSVLDIGICAHTEERMASPHWKHKIICDSASYCLGIDIDVVLLGQLQDRGYNVRVCDATSDEDLGRRFDFIHAGDVIEHVDSPVALLRFCKRHLSPLGTILVRTPNPYHYNYMRLVRRYGTDRSNMEHVAYIVPFHMVELCRRIGLDLKRYYVLRKRGRTLFKNILKWLYWGWLPDEIYSTIFVYEIGGGQQAGQIGRS